MRNNSISCLNNSIFGFQNQFLICWQKLEKTFCKRHFLIKWTELCFILSWVGGWLGSGDELTLKLTSASTKVGIEVGLSLAINLHKSC